MRRLPLALLALACAHGPRAIEPSAWRELESEHFRVRTDLAATEARRTVRALEEVRAALVALGWSRNQGGVIAVLELGDRAEMAQYAAAGVEGFVTEDAFRDPIMVINGSQDPGEQTFLKHELAHVMTGSLLARNPRWLAEGLACYLETLRLGADGARVGEVDASRVGFLRSVPLDAGGLLRSGRDVERWSAREQYAFESRAWALVHWLIDTRPLQFEAFLRALAGGADSSVAFPAAFPGLDDAAMARGVSTWLAAANPLVRAAPSAAWNGAIVERPLPAGEVFALLADLERISPASAPLADRSRRMQSLLARALVEDPGNPLALQLAGSGDASSAARLHAGDWRAWMVVANRDSDPRRAIETAARLAPDHPGVLARLAWARLREGDREGALRHALRAVELAPSRADFLDTLAQIEAAGGRCGAAIEHEQRAVEALQDGADPSTVRELRARQAVLEDRCGRASDISRTTAFRQARPAE